MKLAKSWRAKVLVHVMLASGLTVLIFVLVSVSAHKADIARLSAEKLELLIAAVERALLVAMAQGRVEELQQIVQGFTGQPDVRRIRLLAPDGRIVASTATQEVGSNLSREYLGWASRPGGNASQTTGTASGGSLHRIIGIENRPACHRCHSKEQSINGYLEVDLDIEPSLRLLSASLWRSVALGLGVTLLMSFVTLRLMHRLVHKPVVELGAKMELAKSGSFEHSVAVPRDDEIGSLAERYNELVAELKRAKDELHERHMKDMQRAEHLATLGELATGLAHEIKNPLAGIKGALEVITTNLPSPAYRDVMREVTLQIERIDAAVRDLLSYARPREPQRSMQDLNALIDGVVTLMDAQARGKNVLLEVTAGEIPPVLVDPEQIRQVLLNLIMNALQACDDRGRITLSTARSTDGHILLTVADTGRGIGSAELNEVFRPFYTTKSRGTGLGLPISQRIVEKHGGTIGLDSVLGRGTTVHVRIPAGNDSSDSVHAGRERRRREQT